MRRQPTAWPSKSALASLRFARFRRPPAIDLFAGCGGTSLGLQAAGFDVRGAVELDPVASLRYQLNVGLSPIVADIRRVSAAQLLRAAKLRPGQCFLLAACPPCQGFSSQRQRGQGDDDPRNALVFEVVRMVRSIRPAYVLFENVPGLAKGAGKELYQEMMSQLRRLGYRTSEGILDSADFGVPQRRSRLIALCSHHTIPTIELPAPTYADPTKSVEDRQGRRDWRTVIEVIGAMPPIDAGGMDSRDPLHVAPSHPAKALDRIRAIPADGGARGALPPDLVLDCHRGHDGHYDVYGRMWWNRPAPTITGGCNKPSKGRFIHPDQHRAITLREAALLQTFPATARFAGSRDRIAEQIGNAVPPDLVKALALPIKAAHDLAKRARPLHHPVRKPCMTAKNLNSLLGQSPRSLNGTELSGEGATRSIEDSSCPPFAQ